MFAGVTFALTRVRTLKLVPTATDMGNFGRT